jgi:hypothetical protein
MGSFMNEYQLGGFNVDFLSYAGMTFTSGDGPVNVVSENFDYTFLTAQSAHKSSNTNSRESYIGGGEGFFRPSSD